MNPRSADCEADALTTTPSRRLADRLQINVTGLQALLAKIFKELGDFTHQYLIQHLANGTEVCPVIWASV